MAQPGDVIEAPSLGVAIEFRTTTDERPESDVIGRPRGFTTQAHVHPRHRERHEGRDANGTQVRFHWAVHADRPLLRTLTPLLRPAFRWSHAWAIARAQEWLEPYARDRAA